MRELTQEEMEALFPARCHFKVIAEDVSGVREELNAVLERLGITEVVFEEGNRSNAGRYISFNASIDVPTHEVMTQIDSGLKQVRNVKMVL